MAQDSQDAPNAFHIVGVWATLAILGYFLGKNVFVPNLEPVAANYFFRQIETPKPEEVRIRVIDTSALYNLNSRPGIDALPPERLKLILDAIETQLPKDRWPIAIGFDFNFSRRHNSDPDVGTISSSHLPEHQTFINECALFRQRTGISIFLGVSNLEFAPKEALLSEITTSRSEISEALTAYTLTERDDPTYMPVEFKIPAKGVDLNNKPNTVSGYTLGARLALALGGTLGGISPIREAENHSTHPGGIVPRRVLVNHSLIRIKDKITIQAGELSISENDGEIPKIDEPATLTSATVFSAEELDQLKNSPKQYALLVGNTMLSDSADISVYQDNPGWLMQGTAVRGIYQHASLAQSLIKNRYARLGHGWSLALELGLSLLSLLLVLANRYKYSPTIVQHPVWGHPLWVNIKKIGVFIGLLVSGIPIITWLISYRKTGSLARQWDKEQRHAAELWGKASIFTLILLLPWFLSTRFELLWFGFVSVAFYLLFEELCSSTLSVTIQLFSGKTKLKSSG